MVLKASKKAGLGQLRIIAGMWRSRRLPVLDAAGLRPTSDRMRETLFNWLQPHLTGARCLDAFSGSGALGFEALSRGAAKATLLEYQPVAAQQLRRNCQTLHTEQANIVQTDTLQWLTQSAKYPYDVVFLDPPFGGDTLTRSCHLLEQGGYLRSGSLVYIELDKAEPIALPSRWCLLRETIHRQAQGCLYRYDL